MTRRILRKQECNFPLFSHDSDDRLSLNFHRFVILYISLIHEVWAFGQYYLPIALKFFSPSLIFHLGMLIVGFMLKNVSRIQIADDIDPGWASALRNIALAVILIKAGLGIDAGALRKLSLVCARLALVPCIMEAVTVAVAAHLLLGFGWDWAFMLG